MSCSIALTNVYLFIHNFLYYCFYHSGFLKSLEMKKKNLFITRLHFSPETMLLVFFFSQMKNLKFSLRISMFFQRTLTEMFNPSFLVCSSFCCIVLISGNNIKTQLTYTRNLFFCDLQFISVLTVIKSALSALLFVHVFYFFSVN